MTLSRKSITTFIVLAILFLATIQALSTAKSQEEVIVKPEISDFTIIACYNGSEIDILFKLIIFLLVVLSPFFILIYIFWKSKQKSIKRTELNLTK